MATFGLMPDGTLGWDVPEFHDEDNGVFDWVYLDDSKLDWKIFYPATSPAFNELQSTDEENGKFSTQFDWWQVSFASDGWFPSDKINRKTGESDRLGSMYYFLELVAFHYSGASWVMSSGKNGYAYHHRLEIGKRLIMSVSWGGSQKLANITVSGSGTHQTRAYLLSILPPSLKASRLDSAFDTRSGTASFQEVVAWAKAAADAAGIKDVQMITNFDPTKGNTLYIGSKASRVQVRIYEKGKQTGYLPDEWWRAELQIRPRTSEKEPYTRFSSDSLWGATNFTRQLWEKLTGTCVSCLDTGFKEVEKDLEHRLLQLSIQYGNLLAEALSIHGSGNKIIQVMDDLLLSIQKPAITGRIVDVPQCPF